ncbi:hypothetical protein Aura_00225 [Pseudomonas phage vB_PpuM-Aura]
MIGNGQAFNVSQELKDATAEYLDIYRHGTSGDIELAWTVVRYEFLKAQATCDAEAIIEGGPAPRRQVGSNFWYDLKMRVPAATVSESFDDAVDLWLETLLDVKRPGK